MDDALGFKIETKQSIKKMRNFFHSNKVEC